MTPPPTVDVPDKLYFKIGEVAKLVGVKPYVLRYWETEFSILRPGKTRSKHRLYRRKDVDTLLEIRRLLYGERYTIEGAKRRLRDTGRLATEPADNPTLSPELRAELLGLYRLLERDLTADDEPTPLTIGDTAHK